jgi:hypothetical protein
MKLMVANKFFRVGGSTPHPVHEDVIMLNGKNLNKFKDLTDASLMDEGDTPKPFANH